MEGREELARVIASEHGLPTTPCSAIQDAGSVNHVYVVGSGVERFVIRFARDPLAGDVFVAEAWCAEVAARHGVPTPAVVATGRVDGVAYGVQEFVPGTAGGQAVPVDTWTTLGAYGQAINEIQPDDAAPPALFSRFGPDLPRAWATHVGYNIDRLDETDPLLEMGVLSRVRQAGLRARIGELLSAPVDFGLSHGDLTSRNLIVPHADPPVLVDWGSASFGPIPFTDLLVLDIEARRSQRGRGGKAVGKDDRSGRPDVDLRAFVSAMSADLDDLRPIFEAFRQLQLLDLVRWALEQRPDRLPTAVNDLKAVL